ncbi:MAG: arylsulfatase, partial [Chloroflexota bacterium]
DIETPVIDGLAGRGLRYTNFHTTALCSPTRACLLTGRNHHTAGLGCIAELSQGYPGYDGMLPPTVALISEVMSERGYATFAIAKWLRCPAEACTPAGPYTRWPLGRGFDHFYGCLGGETNQYYPDLVRDNTFVEQPKSAADGYHLTEDLTDSAISYVRDLRSVDQTKPFFMYFCPGACHAPHQVPQEWIDRYRGKFDKGWDAWREETFRRQKALGIVPADAELSPRPDWVAAWDTLGDDERRLYARMMEVFAAFLSHTDHHLGRLIDALRKTGDLDNTLIMLVSDNGASAEGGFHGSFNENLIFNGIPDTVEQNLPHIDDLGSERSFGHYPTGWVMAANTPFRRWKRNVHNGGIADPLVVSWPAKITTNGEVRTQYSHAIDVAATVMEAVGMEFPHHVKGVPQESVAGESLVPTFNDGAAPEVRTTQYYEMFGSRALYKDGWKAVTFHAPPGIPADGPGDPTLPFTKDEWELYDLRKDPAEIHNLAEVERERLQEMIVLWYVEAGKHNVLPLHAEQQKGQRPRPFTEPDVYRYWPHTTRIDNEAAVKVLMRPFSVLASATIPEGGAEGVLIAQGGKFGGWTFFMQDGRLQYEHNFLGLESYRVASE